MTDENKAPERIWAWPKGSWFIAGASDQPVNAAGAIDRPYTREDVALAMVAAAYEAAAKEADDYMEPHVANGILSLTPDDARAALDRMLAEARREGAKTERLLAKIASLGQEFEGENAKSPAASEEGGFID